MPGVVRLGDTCSGHGAFPSRAVDQGSPNVNINGKPAVRVGDHWVTHCDPKPSCHDSVGASGSPTVFVNGKPLMRVGDAIACGSTAATGSSDVNAN
ncbi:PAAR domain containing protein [Yersinia phage YerA41]|jgi:uncharacterized Zn-binding protein involved in type VI secretion|nr:PAAR domain containing protein [Yersinia phage YerA41]